MQSVLRDQPIIPASIQASVKFWLLQTSKVALILLLWTPEHSNAQEVSQDIEEIIHVINDIRSEGYQCGDTYYAPAEPLVWDDDLAKAADLHVKDMIIRGYFAHKSPDGERAFGRVADVTDRFRDIRENIARGSKDDIGALAGWMESPGHCANIMQPQITHVGLAARTGEEIANKHGITEPYLVMKLGKATREIDQKTPRAIAAVPENKKSDLTVLEFDSEAALNILNEVRKEGASCDGDAGRNRATHFEIGLHDELEQAARSRALILAENAAEVGRGDERELKRTWVRADGLRMAHYIYEKASFNFEDALRKWLSDPPACRRITANSITIAGVAAAAHNKSGAPPEAEDSEAYWVFMFSIVTPESMKDEIVSGLAEADITVYGQKNCGKTRRLHRELEGFGIEHAYLTYESGNGPQPNREKMHAEAMQAEKRIGSGNSLPYVTVGNTMYRGFSSAAVLYRAVQGSD